MAFFMVALPSLTYINDASTKKIPKTSINIQFYLYFTRMYITDILFELDLPRRWDIQDQQTPSPSTHSPSSRWLFRSPPEKVKVSVFGLFAWKTVKSD